VSDLQEIRKVLPLNKLRFHVVRRRGSRGPGLDVLRQPPVGERAREDPHDLEADVMATPNYSIGVLDRALDSLGRRRGPPGGAVCPASLVVKSSRDRPAGSAIGHGGARAR
jgi:hypothetical protein